jgi:thiol-disulfide isomerase/thioredoxin
VNLVVKKQNIMRKISILLSIIALTTVNSCAERVIVNREVESKNDGKMLLGTQTLDQFRKDPFKTWFDEEYNRYQVDQTGLAELKEKLNSYSLVVFVGSWCEDSHREFPRLIKILDALKYNTGKMQIIAVNRKKNRRRRRRTCIILAAFQLLLSKNTAKKSVESQKCRKQAIWKEIC